ncbi:MAG TPA: GH92 family glycosyl hydrolase [Chloroflexia bacterium]|nr:GH92 family glycosyl hydrolase [Chloroflexia bacterium]
MSRNLPPTLATLLLLLSLLGPGWHAPLAYAGPTSGPRPTLNLTPYVNPMIGTAPSNSPDPVGGGAGGSTYPGAEVPFGMVQFSPDTPNGSPSGYAYDDTTIEDVSLTHFNGAGCPNNEDLNILPITGALGASPGTSWTSYSSVFTHTTELAAPGYYRVNLDSYNTRAELAATTRTGMARFTYPATTQATVLVNDSRMATGNRNGAVTIVGTNEIDGSATGGGFCGGGTFSLYFAVQFDQAFTAHGTWAGGTITPGSGNASGIQTGAYVTFDTTTNPVVQMKVALSYVSLANAQQNLAAENPGWNFNTVQANAGTAWNTILNRIQVTGGAPADLTKFYTALYHVLQDPSVASDVNGQYMGFDNTVHTKPGSMGAVYENYSGWDIYRSWAALVAMIAPTEMSDIAASMVLAGQEGGELPKWSHQNREDFIMTGDPGPIIVASAYAFGARNFDTTAALTLMKKSSSVLGATMQGSPIRGNLNYELSLHYVPGDASDSQEYMASDFAIGQFAQRLGATAVYQDVMPHAQYWINTFNPTVGYQQPRNTDGTWACTYLNPASTCGFTEGNAAQYTWMVPYNMGSLINLMGGNPTAIQRLDHLFTELNAGLNRPYFYIGNEPEFSTPWAYNFAAAPWKTQNIVRQILNVEYTTDPGGLPGNDDLGAMSGVAVWGYLGLYPAIPGTDVLVLNGPLFPAATIQLASGKTLQINAAGAGQGNPYIQSVDIDERPPTTQNWLPFSSIANGAMLDFAMGPSPNFIWGSHAADVPPSYNDGFTPPPPAPDLGANLAQGRTATGSVSCATAESPDKAVDGTLMNNSKWCSLVTSRWLQIDLGASQTVNTFVIKHAALGGETAAWNTRDYDIQVSLDGTTWTTVVTRTGNAASRTVDTIAAQPVRYVKLDVTTPTQNGDPAARIYEVEVFNSGSARPARIKATAGPPALPGP